MAPEESETEMYELITTKGRKSAADLATLAAWLVEMQPSSTRIAHGDPEAEVEWHDETAENDLRWALRLEEANVLNLTVHNDNIYIAGLGSGHVNLIYLRRDADRATLVDNTNEVSRELRDDETLAEVLAAVQRGDHTERCTVGSYEQMAGRADRSKIETDEV